MPYKDPEKRRAVKKAWREANPEYARAYRKYWYSTNEGRTKTLEYNRTLRIKRKSEMADDPRHKQHGSTSGYSYGCRCERCKAAMSEYQRAHRAKKAGDVDMTDTDAADVLTIGIIYCCDTCGTPTESEPCRKHQPAAWKRWWG